MYDGISKLKNNFYFEFVDSVNAVRTLLKKGKIKINKNGIFDIAMEFGSDNKKQLEEYMENIHSLKLADIQENTKWTTSFLDKFVIDIKEYKKFIENISIENCLIENKKINIYDSNNKKRRNKKAEIKINDDTKIFKIIVTTESFNDIEARIDKVKILSLSSNTLVFCLDDLRVYNEYFAQHPCYFIQYLLQRKKTIGNKNIDLVDELYHLGMWIEYNFYNEHTNEQIKYFTKRII